MTTSRIGLLAAAAALAISGACAHGGSSSATPSSATPSYTNAQAVDGERTYRAACVACHGTALEGEGDAPPLVGASFARRWAGHPVGELIGFMGGHMPGTLPGQLSDRSYLDATAYLLASNGVTPGATPLAADATWAIPLEPR